MSAAAILSVAARKAASEGKKVGAAALTLIALVVMSLTVFPGLNRATTDQMADAPVNPGSSQGTGLEVDASTEGGSSQDEPTSEADSVGSPETTDEVTSVASPSPQAKAGKPALANDEDALAKLFDSTGSKSRVIFQDQVLKATSKDGITAEFIFNPSSEKPFTQVGALFTVKEQLFSIFPDSSEWVVATDLRGLEHFVYLGSMDYVFDENGKVWSDSKLAKGTLRIEVVVDTSLGTVHEVILNILPKG
jgi:hypothetical protein